MSIDSVMAEQHEKLDACLHASLERIRRVEPPARHPYYNTASDPYRMIGALPLLYLEPTPDLLRVYRAYLDNQARATEYQRLNFGPDLP